jgi:hypothetical protein
VGSDEDADEDGDSLTDNWLINPARRWRAHLSRIIITFNNNVLLFGQSQPRMRAKKKISRKDAKVKRRKGRLERRSSRQSLIPIDPILPSNPFTFGSAKAVSSDQQGQAITDRMKADADPGGIKTERCDHPQTKNDTDNQIQLGPRPER